MAPDHQHSTKGQSHSTQPVDLDQIVEETIRSQHPEWVKPDGTCPRCASYVYELADELAGIIRQTKEDNDPPPPKSP